MAPKFFDEWQFKPPLPYVTQAPVPPPVVAALDFLRYADCVGDVHATGHLTEVERRAYDAALSLLTLYFAEAAGHVRGWVDPDYVVRDLIPKT